MPSLFSLPTLIDPEASATIRHYDHHKRDNGSTLDGLIAHNATEPAIRRQLERLPAFVVPADTDATFRDLLSRLDRQAASGLPLPKA